MVLAILSAVAFVATGTFRHVHDEADDRLVRVEMQEIAKAIRQFRQDTGYLPKTGPFALAADSGGVPIANLPGEAGATDEAKRRWFYSPANFYQLLGATSPLDGTGHTLAAWDPESGRGWRGPYLKGYAEGYVAIGDDVNDDDSAVGDPTGDPLAGDVVADVPGLADPFAHRPAGGGALLGWSVVAGGEVRPKWGRPYLFLDLDSSAATTRMGLVSMGPDGLYGTDDDIELPCD